MSEPVFDVVEMGREPLKRFAETIEEQWARRYRLHSWHIDSEADTIIAVFEWVPPG